MRWTGHVVGRPSWRASVDMPPALVVALHIRDASGLQAGAQSTIPPNTVPMATVPMATVPPPLEPFVDRDGALAEHATQAAAAAWGPWWVSLLDRHPEFRGVPPLVPDPFPPLPAELRTLIAAGLSGAEAWFTARKREQIETLRNHGGVPDPFNPVREIVGQLEAESGRPVAPFDLLISVLPVQGRWGRRVGRDHVLVSRHLMEYTDGVAAFLEPVLRDLAG